MTESKAVAGGKKRELALISSTPFEVSKRKLSVTTMEKFRYHQGDFEGEAVHVGNYFKDGRIVAQKMRFANKDFKWRGNQKEAPLFGQWLWRDGGKKVVITEGEIDCMSVSQAQGNKWPVVSVNNGAQGAKKDLSKQLEWLEQFSEIIFCFDDDEPGRAAVEECIPLFTPGKVKVARLPLKDANEMLKAGRADELIAALWDAKAHRPDGVSSGLDVLAEGNWLPEWGDSFPWETVTNWTYGMRPHEMIAYGAGTGVGKTDTFKKIIAHLTTKLNRKVGALLLEEPDLMLTLETVAGHADGVLYHIPDQVVDEERKSLTVKHVASMLEMYKVCGSVDTQSIMGVIRYMVAGLGCTHIFLDHITYILDGEEGESQNTAMKVLMRSLNDINKELPFTLHYISHLRKSKAGGKTHEEGGRVTLDDFAGGKAATQYANFVFGIERDQQSDEDDKDYSLLRGLKDRYTGRATGKTLGFFYDTTTGQKHEVEHQDKSLTKGHAHKSNATAGDYF